MAIWGLDKIPLWKNKQKKEHGIVQTDRGFEDAKTGEVLVSISRLSARAGTANVESIAFDKASYVQGDTMKVVVTFNERVICGVPATLVVSSTGVSGNFTATALAFPDPKGISVVEFSAVVPAEAATLSLAAQTIAGGIFDALDTRPLSDTSVSASQAAAAGSRVVA